MTTIMEARGIGRQFKIFTGGISGRLPSLRYIAKTISQAGSWAAIVIKNNCFYGLSENPNGMIVKLAQGQAIYFTDAKARTNFLGRIFTNLTKNKMIPTHISSEIRIIMIKPIVSEELSEEFSKEADLTLAIAEINRGRDHQLVMFDEVTKKLTAFCEISQGEIETLIGLASKESDKAILERFQKNTLAAKQIRRGKDDLLDVFRLMGREQYTAETLNRQGIFIIRNDQQAPPSPSPVTSGGTPVTT